MHYSNHLNDTYNKQTNSEIDLVKLTYKNNIEKEIPLVLNEQQIFKRLKWFQINQRLEETINELQVLINYFNDCIASKGVTNNFFF